MSDNDTRKKQQRIKAFEWLFPRMVRFIDSVGVKNLDAKPTRFFEKDTAYFKPFTSSKSWMSNNAVVGISEEFLAQTLTYFDKRKPDKPLGTLLFEPNTHRLAAWIIFRQGSRYFFLTFNLL